MEVESEFASHQNQSQNQSQNQFLHLDHQKYSAVIEVGTSCGAAAATGGTTIASAATGGTTTSANARREIRDETPRLSCHGEMHRDRWAEKSPLAPSNAAPSDISARTHVAATSSSFRVSSANVISAENEYDAVNNFFDLDSSKEKGRLKVNNAR
jgi:hypothetical protein